VSEDTAIFVASLLSTMVIDMGDGEEVMIVTNLTALLMMRHSMRMAFVVVGLHAMMVGLVVMLISGTSIRIGINRDGSQEGHQGSRFQSNHLWRGCCARIGCAVAVFVFIRSPLCLHLPY
jgi:hypothetical protein